LADTPAPQTTETSPESLAPSTGATDDGIDPVGDPAPSGPQVTSTAGTDPAEDGPSQERAPDGRAEVAVQPSQTTATTTGAMEQELKLGATSDALTALESSASLAAGIPLSASTTHEVRDRYLDTPDRAFLRAGFVLRERIAQGALGTQHVLTLKGLAKGDDDGDGVHRRLEVEGPLAGAATDSGYAGWPGAVLDLATIIAGKRLQSLETLVELRQIRRERTAHGPQDIRLGTLSLDEARAVDLEGIATGRWHEVEFELAPCPPEHRPLQARAMAALREMPELVQSEGSKFERALRAVADHPPGAPSETHGIQSDMPMAEAGRLIWRNELTEMLLHEAGARRGDDIEFVHRYRVAIRRARAADKLFGPYFEHKQVKAYLKHMKRTARLLGAIRDRDVALDKLGTYRTGLTPAESSAMHPLEERWLKQRREAYDVLLPWLDSKAHRRFIRDFGTLCATPGAGALHLEAPTPFQVRHVLPDAIWSRFSAVRAYEPLIDAGEPPVETLHALRIDCKRLRYTLEPVQDLLGREGLRLVKHLKRLQDHLGDLNDAGVTMEDLYRSRAEGDDDASIEHYIEVQRAEEERLRLTFREHWAPFVGEANRARLGRALARL